MPKHVPTFKHLIASSSTTTRPQKKERSVNELIAASRSDHLGREGRDQSPHIAISSRRSELGVPAAGDESTLAGCGTGPIHPAELLRRAEVNRRQAARSVAGPVPPPSWRSRSVLDTKDGSSSSTAHSTIRPGVTRDDLICAEALFTHRSSSSASPFGTVKLVEHCLRAVLGYLENDEIITDRCEDLEGNRQEAQDRTWTIGQAMREQVGYLEPHLKIALLDIASLLPEGHPSRLSDRSLRAILTRPADYHTLTTTSDDGTDDYRNGYLVERGPDDDWSDTSDPLPDIKHLAITIHPKAMTILGQVSAFPNLTLTSLNLAYSSIRDLEKLVLSLQPGLRELGLVGVRFIGAKISAEDDGWKRGLGALGRRMIVLKMLDLSYPSSPLTFRSLSALLQPVNGKAPLPSLGTLGLRGMFQTLPPPEGMSETRDGWVKSDVSAILRHSERKKWVEVIWD